MAQPDKDASVLAHIERLVHEEHQLFERSELAPEESQRLAQVQTELDQCWDLLRQRRAKREFGDDPSQAHARPADVVKKYIG
jgi:flagellar biosynthesis/type III secretory pathway chaperone